jgi:hypothetical protein
MSAPLRIIRADRAVRKCNVGDLVYHGRDAYGCASDDTRVTGIEHVSVSFDESGLPFFTIPREDVSATGMGGKKEHQE